MNTPVAIDLILIKWPTAQLIFSLFTHADQDYRDASMKVYLLGLFTCALTEYLIAWKKIAMHGYNINCKKLIELHFRSSSWHWESCIFQYNLRKPYQEHRIQTTVFSGGGRNWCILYKYIQCIYTTRNGGKYGHFQGRHWTFLKILNS